MNPENGALPVSALRALREQISQTTEALVRHETIASRRNIFLPDGAISTLKALETELTGLEVLLGTDEIEVGQLRALAKTSVLINSSLDVDNVLASAMDELINLTGAERGFILLVNRQTNRLEFRISRGLNDAELREDEVSRTILRDVIAHGKPIQTDNAMEDTRLAESETVAKFVLRSIMCVPLIFRDRTGSSERVDGAIYVDNKFRQAVFSTRELNLLTAFAHQAAVAIENAMLYQQVQQTLIEITRARAIIENVFASIESGVITTMQGGQVSLFNRAAGEILRSTPEDSIGKPLQEVLPKLREDLNAQITAAAETGSSAMLEAQTEVAGRGRIVLNMRISPLKTAGGETQGAAMVLDDLTEEREREETFSLMTRYLPPGLMDNIHQIADLAMGGERREVTCVFMTACQWSAFPSSLRPQQRMDLLNVYLQTATQVVHQAQGVLDKYLGNEIMILFNTQLNPDLYHARHAVEMALALKDAFADLAEKLGNDPALPQYTIAMHTGVATLGNVGSLRRRSFTAIGDTINLAKRIHETCLPGQVLLTGSTLEHIQATSPALRHIRFEQRNPLQARGRQEQTGLFEAFYA